MNEWKESTLGDELVVQRGHDLPKLSMIEGKFPVCSSSGILGYHNEHTHGGHGLTIGRSGHGIGKVFYYDEPFWAHNTVLYVKSFKGNHPKFFFYFLKNLDFTAFNTGSAIPSLNRNHLYLLKINIPELEEQKAIADVLSALDDKIDLLQRQNETLEKMAETLFRQWFIEEAKEDWEEVALDDICNIQNGYAFSSKDYIPLIQDELEVLKMGHIDKNCTLKVNPKRDYVPRDQKLDRYILNEDDIVLAMTDMKDNVAILGIPALVDASNRYVLNQRVARITLRESSKLKSVYFLFLQLKDSVFIEVLRSKANSGVQVNLSTQAIKDSCLIMPPYEKQIEVEPIFSSIYGKVKNNNSEVQTLQNLRDTLLPKLMSGEVRVKLD